MIDASIGQLAHLRHLDVSRNNIDRLPESLSDCTKLQKLNVSDNIISTLPGLNLPLLETLELSRNKISALHAHTFTRLAALTVLDVRYNQLEGGAPLPSGAPSPRFCWDIID